MGDGSGVADGVADGAPLDVGVAVWADAAVGDSLGVTTGAGGSGCVPGAQGGGGMQGVGDAVGTCDTSAAGDPAPAVEVCAGGVTLGVTLGVAVAAPAGVAVPIGVGVGGGVGVAQNGGGATIVAGRNSTVSIATFVPIRISLPRMNCAKNPTMGMKPATAEAIFSFVPFISKRWLSKMICPPLALGTESMRSVRSPSCPFIPACPAKTSVP